MASLPATLAWCVLQVTLLAAFVATGCLVLRKSAPATRSLATFTGLGLIVLLTFAAFAPWPRWPTIEVRAPRGTSAAVRRPADLPLTPSNSPGPSVEQAAAVVPVMLPANDVQASSPAVHLLDSLVADLQSPPPEGSAEARWTWPTFLAAAILVGVAIGTLRLLVGLVLVRSYRTHSRPIRESELHELRDILQAELECPQAIELLESDTLVTAATVGWRRPLVILPASWREWNDDEKRAVLAHEIAHIQRRDFLTWVAAQGALVLHFYHPLVHWLCGRLRLEQELAADAAAARLAGGQQTYLATLAAMALRQADRPVAWPARTFLPTRGTFLRRIEMLRDMKLGSKASVGVRAGTVGVILAAGLAISGLRGAARGPSDALAEAPPTEAGQAATGGKGEVERQATARNNLRLIGLALHNYHDVHKKLPPAVLYGYKGNGQSKYPHSWRVAILQYMSDEGIKLYDEYKFDEPWDSDGNKKVLAKMPLIFRDPNDPADSTNSSYFVLVGTAGTAAVAGATARTYDDDDRAKRQTTIASVFASTTGTQIGRITDGTSNVLMVVEAQRDIPWTKPDDIPYAADKPIPKLGGHYRGGFLTALCDGHVDFIADTIDEKTLRNLITMNDGEVVKFDRNLDRKSQPGLVMAAGLTDPESASKNNLKHIGLAMHNFHDTFASFPPAVLYGTGGNGQSKYPHSWRVAILPFLNEAALYNQYKFDEPWDSEDNKKILAQMPAVFRDPKAPADTTNSSYFVFVGEPAVDVKPAAGTAAVATRGLVGIDAVTTHVTSTPFWLTKPDTASKGASMRQITDGTSNTFLVVEAERDIPWTKPEDIRYADDPKAMPRLGGHHSGGFVALFGDGSVHFISNRIDTSTLRCLILMNDGLPTRFEKFRIKR